MQLTLVLSMSIVVLLSTAIVGLSDVFIFAEWTAAGRTNGCSFLELETACKTFCRFDQESASERTLYMFQVAIYFLL